MGELVGVTGALGPFAIALVIFGLAPGFVLAAIVRLIPDVERRRELQAELYEVPRWEQPFWVAQQLEVAIRLGLAPRVSWYWGRYVWLRAKIDCGLERHREYPDSFWVPSADEKAALQPGDLVKLMWSVRPKSKGAASGERMWVSITRREGDQLEGALESWPVVVYLEPGETVKFHIDDIIDYDYDLGEADSVSAGEAA